MSAGLLTFGTGADTDAFDGACVVWMHVPRGGYGYVVPVDATIVSFPSRGRATIEVQRRDGARVKRTVLLASLRWRSAALDTAQKVTRATASVKP